MSLEFEWDPKKAAANLKKHGVSFGEAITVFADPLARIFDDDEHSSQERREIIIGHSVERSLNLGELHWHPRGPGTHTERSEGDPHRT